MKRTPEEHEAWVKTLPDCEAPWCKEKAHRFFRMYNDCEFKLCDKCFNFVERIWVAQEVEGKLEKLRRIKDSPNKLPSDSYIPGHGK